METSDILSDISVHIHSLYLIWFNSISTDAASMGRTSDWVEKPISVYKTFKKGKYIPTWLGQNWRTPPDWVQLQWGSQRGRAPLVELFARQPANLNVGGCKFEAQIESVLITRHLPTPFWKLMVYGRQEGGK